MGGIGNTKKVLLEGDDSDFKTKLIRFSDNKNDLPYLVTIRC